MLFPHMWGVRFLLLPFLSEQIRGMLVMPLTGDGSDDDSSIPQHTHDFPTAFPSVTRQHAIKLEDATHLPAHIITQ